MLLCVQRYWCSPLCTSVLTCIRIILFSATYMFVLPPVNLHLSTSICVHSVHMYLCALMFSCLHPYFLCPSEAFSSPVFVFIYVYLCSPVFFCVCLFPYSVYYVLLSSLMFSCTCIYVLLCSALYLCTSVFLYLCPSILTCVCVLLCS